MKISRRSALALLAAPALRLDAQGVASRGVKAQPRGKPSGIPFLAKFTDGSVFSSLTVTLYTVNSLDGAGICVQPQ